ncbi:MAG: hypothetical protein HY297_05510 [Thaumarchaeota archaeon]|nr:hypothetical protein [Nitrososphaerota archaeon]
MTEESDARAGIMEAHQEFVAHIEGGASRMRVLSAVTVAVSAVLALSYLSQLLLPLLGTRSVTVNLGDPGVQAGELAVLAVALAWLYVGLRDLRFSSRMKKEILAARAREKEMQDRIIG